MEEPATEEVQRQVRTALAEDVGDGDVTTLATVPAEAEATAFVVAREDLVVAGLGVAESVFKAVDAQLTVERLAEEGCRAGAGDNLLRVQGSARGILTAERVALNFLQRLCGIATLTRQFVDAVAGFPTVILETRKTTPGLRQLEKYAVQCGGGRNHRFGLYDAVLIKDNHLALLGGTEHDPVATAVQRARARYPGLSVEVEADRLEQVDQALAAGADIILLDNMTKEQMREAVTHARGRAKTEASGGIQLDSVRAVAETGVDYISVGALTHSVRAMDIALEIREAMAK